MFSASPSQTAFPGASLAGSVLAGPGWVRSLDQGIRKQVPKEWGVVRALGIVGIVGIEHTQSVFRFRATEDEKIASEVMSVTSWDCLGQGFEPSPAQLQGLDWITHHPEYRLPTEIFVMLPTPDDAPFAR
ncbi:hypothetical protein DFH09DRAFT_1072252 [Mycena vulgaris]|nr:hypothetical protein DFH09DRAFT_1072252 [Mycena vulgaris]